VQQELFLCDEVLHTNVDNLVESSAWGRANSAKFNTMIQIALLWCNARESRPMQGRIFVQSDERHGVVGRKAQYFDPQEFLNGKPLQMSG
jgi:hypothetical protein